MNKKVSKKIPFYFSLIDLDNNFKKKEKNSCCSDKTKANTK